MVTGKNVRYVETIATPNQSALSPITINGAMAMIAVGDAGSFPRLPQMYMRKMAVGPVAREKIDLRRPIGDNVRAIAEAFGRNTNDITAIVLDRPRHHDLIEEIRAAGPPAIVETPGDLDDMRADIEFVRAALAG